MVLKILPLMWAGRMTIGNAGLILYLDAKLSDPFYADSLVVLLTTVDGTGHDPVGGKGVAKAFRLEIEI
jgi:hypothetical protein